MIQFTIKFFSNSNGMLSRTVIAIYNYYVGSYTCTTIHVCTVNMQSCSYLSCRCYSVCPLIENTMATHQSLSEVFTRHYSQLCDTLTDVDNLLPHFVQHGVISTNDLEEISAIVPSTKKQKVQKLMIHISGPLKAGNTEVLYTMLRIMEEHGHHATRHLADQIRKSLTATNESSKDSSCHSKLWLM